MTKQDINKTEFTKIWDQITFPYKDLSKSYRESRSTFSVVYWVDILTALLYEKRKTGEIEKTYTSLDPKRTNKKPSNNMYTSVLRNKMLIKPLSNIKKPLNNLNKYSYDSVRKQIANYMVEVMTKYYKDKKIFNDFLSEYRIEFHNHFNENNFIENTTNYEKNITNKNVELVKFNWKKNPSSTITKLKNITQIKNNLKSDNWEKIGAMGEKLVYEWLLKNKFKKIVWEAMIGNKYSPYDFSYYLNGIQHFIEVKSTTSINNQGIRYFLSKNEFKFANNNYKNYHIYFVSAVLRGKSSQWTLPQLRIIDFPKFIVNQKAVNSNELEITPYQYIGYKKY